MEANGKDEIQLQVRSDQVELVMEICESAMPAVGEYLGFRCPLGAEAKSGKNWAETH